MDQTENRFYREPGRPPLPPKIAAAIATVMTRVPTLAKGEQNKHGGYKFASIDDFLEAVRPLCTEAGLLIVPDEEHCEVNGDWLTLKFSFMLSHKDGETWDHRPTRTVMVSAKMGAQAFGAAQSYALKQFMRGLFQIATGDGEDADAHDHGDLSQGRRQQNGNGHQNGRAPERPRREDYQNGNGQNGRVNGNARTTAPQMPPNGNGKSVKQAKEEISACKTKEQLKQWKEANAEWLDKLAGISMERFEEVNAHFDDVWGLNA